MEIIKPFFDKYLKYVLLAALLYMPLFGHLDTLPIRVWDEARLAQSAYEMANNGDLIVTYYRDSPDMWSTKPPLMIWAQALCMKVFGVNELSVRLPSAIAALLTCIGLLVFFQRYLRSFWFGALSVMVLVTSLGYISVHGVRTGDYDAMLTLFTTLNGLFFFAFIEKRENKYLYFFFACTTLAVLTKGITCFMFFPALGIYALLQKQVLPILKNKHFYFGLLGFLGISLGYYLLREAVNPGFLAAVQQNELGGRYLETITENYHGFWFYFTNILEPRFTAWHLIIPCGIVFGLYSKNQKIFRLTLFSTLMAVTFFLIISSAKTQFRWYDIPLYPYLAIIVSVFIYSIYDFLKQFKGLDEHIRWNSLPFIFLFLVFINPYRAVVNQNYKPEEIEWDEDFYEISYYLKEAVDGKHDLDGKYLVYKGYDAHNLFYLNILNDRGVDVRIESWRMLGEGDQIVTYQENVKQYIEDRYFWEVTSKYGRVWNYNIKGLKDPSVVKLMSLEEAKELRKEE